MNVSALTELLSKISKEGAEGISEEQRVALVEAVGKARIALQTPIERGIDLTLGPHDASATRVAVDMGLMDIAVQHKGPVSIAHLAEKSSADVDLVMRVMRYMVALGFFTQEARDSYSPTPAGLTFLAPGSPMREFVIYLGDGWPATALLPKFLKEIQWRNSPDGYNSPYQYAYQIPGTLAFDAWDERILHAFTVVMGLQPKGTGKQWFDLWPTEEKLKMDDPERPVFVDVGGNVGHDLAAFATRFPSLTGKLVLADLAHTVAKVPPTLPSSITPVAIDFFKPPLPAPLQGAKAFYMRSILHDWPIDQSHTILTNIRDAMADDSLLLLNEVVLPEEGTTLWESRQDWQMLINGGGLERTEKQWRALLEGAGFKLMNIVPTEQASLIECVKA